MNKLIIATVLLISAGCSNFSPYVGLSLHDKSLDSPEVDLSTGLGFAGFEFTPDNWRYANLFCEHLSGISTTETGGGLNHCGFIFRK